MKSKPTTSPGDAKPSHQHFCLNMASGTEFLFPVLQISSSSAVLLIKTVSHLKLNKVTNFISFLKKFSFFNFPT